MDNASRLDTRWLKAAFLLLLVGYGTKMGLAPMHTWLPDAHSEAPSVVSALLSGALLNCAFLAILRIFSVVCRRRPGTCSAGKRSSSSGLSPWRVAAGLIIGQPDYKRMLAYSSVEHMGILAVGIGLGGLGDWGALFHAVNHSLIKAVPVSPCGKHPGGVRHQKISDVRGALRALPVTAVLWVAGFFAITGRSPLRRVCQRARHPAGRRRVGVMAGRCGFLPSPGRGVRRDDQRARAHGAGSVGKRPRIAGARCLSLVAPLSPPAALPLPRASFIPGFLDRALWRAVMLLGV